MVLMIFEIQPVVYDTSDSRKALYEVLDKLNIRQYYIYANTDYLTIDMSEEDASVFVLAEGRAQVLEIMHRLYSEMILGILR
jgi:hypothetical protein